MIRGFLLVAAIALAGGAARAAPVELGSAELDRVVAGYTGCGECYFFGSFNIGVGNTGNRNIGLFNSGNNNIGVGNTGDYNIGINNGGNWPAFRRGPL